MGLHPFCWRIALLLRLAKGTSRTAILLHHKIELLLSETILPRVTASCSQIGPQPSPP